jgi:hypothetical protein
MTRLRRSAWIAIPLIALVATALAQPTRTATVPDRCKQFLDVPRDSRSLTIPWEQRLSLAACRQSVTLAPTSNPAEFPQVIARINEAMEPSLAIYRDAAARGPTPQIRMLAEYGLGMSYVTSMIRARNAVAVSSEDFGGATYGANPDPYQQAHQPMEVLLPPYRDGAVTAFLEVGRIAAQNPAEARANPVVAFVVADAKTTANLLMSTTEAATPSVSRR